MSVRHMTIRGFDVAVDEIHVTSSNGTVHPYLRARLRMGTDPVTHRARPAKVVTAKTEDELVQAVEGVMDVRTRLCLNGIGASKITVEEWCDYYLSHYLQGATSTKRCMRGVCRNRIAPYLGPIYVQELTEAQVEDFRDHLLRERGLAPRTVAGTLSTLRVILDRAVHQRVIAINPATMVRKPQAGRSQKRALTAEEISGFMAELPKDRYGNLLGLLLTTGFRVGEGLGLMESRVDVPHGRITVDHHVICGDGGGKGRMILCSSTKTGVNRTIAVPRQALEYIESELEDRAERERRAGPAWDNSHNLVFVGNKGQIISYGAVDTHVKRIGARIGRPNLTIHELRHTAATVLYLESRNIIWVRDMLGHLNLATTERYVHVTEEDLQAIPRGHSRDMARVASEDIPVALHLDRL